MAMTPLERAARALVDNYPLDSGESPLSWQEVLPVARAVIEAIREPSEAMLATGDSAVDELPYGHTIATSELSGVFTAMIDALLEEGR